MSTSIFVWLQGGQAGHKEMAPELDNGLEECSSEAVTQLNLCPEKSKKLMTPVYLYVCPLYILAVALIKWRNPEKSA